MKKMIYTLVAFLLPLFYMNAQQVIVTDDASYTTPASGSVLDVKSTSKGFMPPRVALTGTTDATTISSPSAGLMLYNTATAGTSPNNVTPGLYYNAGTSGSPSWSRVLNTDATNGMTIQDDGSLIFNGTATVWDDIMIPGFSTKASTNSPAFAVFLNGVFINYFDDAGSNSENQVYFTVQFPHSWAQTAIFPHIHWSPESDPGGDAVVRWGLEYTWVEYNATTALTFPATTTVYVNGACKSGDQKKHLIASFGSITPTADQNGISSMMVCRLFRNSGDNADTYNSKRAGFLQFDIHFEKNTEGSRLEFTK